MGGHDRTILLVVPMVAAVIALWLLVVSPKQDEVSKLDSQISTLQSEVSEQEKSAQQGLEARKQFPRDYHRLVVMGKAVPVDDETASLVVQINRIADGAGVSFQSIELSSGGTAEAAPAPAPTTPAPSESSESESSGETSEDSSSSSSASTTASTTTAAPATESAAAMLPIGASVGSAGLPTLPYTLIFRGSYFQIADFLAGIDRLVDTGKARIRADGRLVTVDGFTLGPTQDGPPTALEANLSVTTYVTPADQGLTAGATPTAPAPVATTPTSASAP